MRGENESFLPFRAFKIKKRRKYRIWKKKVNFSFFTGQKKNLLVQYYYKIFRKEKDGRDIMKKKWLTALGLTFVLSLSGMMTSYAMDNSAENVAESFVEEKNAETESAAAIQQENEHEADVTDSEKSTEDVIDPEESSENSGITEEKNGWVEESDGIHYYQEGKDLRNAGYSLDGYWYYFDADGVMKQNSFRQKNGQSFYYDGEGHLVLNEELDINGKHYKFTESGAAYTGLYTDGTDTYYYQADGSRAEDAGMQLNGYWCYFQKDGKLLSSGWREKAGNYYYYDEAAHLVTNRGIELDGHWYYVDGSGRRYTAQFRQKNNTQYYYDENGYLVTNCELDINGKHYKFTGSGAVYTGWYVGEDGLYYYDQQGFCLTDTGKKLSGYWYYFQKDGKMLSSGWREKDGSHYYYDAQGHLILNAGMKIDGYWYYLDGNGRRYESQFRQKGADWYYYDEEGHLVLNRDMKIGKYRYIFQNNGAAYRGLKTENGKVIGFTPLGRQAFDDGVKDGNDWYYFDAAGNMKKDYWRTKDGGKYYYQADGTLARNKGLKIGGNWYYLTDSGKMHTGWRNKDGYRYYYNSYGHLVMNGTITINGVTYRFDAYGRLMNSPRRISVFSTVSTNNYNGTYNMTKALLYFNQVTIQPGQTLSFFGIAGPCGKAQGFLPGGVVGGVGYGGGICQASTTLYGAALRAGLTIVQRRNHSVPSTYVPIGQDAMVNYGSSDLKIRNDYNYAVKLVTYVSGNTLYAEVWGIQPDWFDSVDIVSWKTGSRSAVAYRKYIKNGQVVKTEQLPSSYYSR